MKKLLSLILCCAALSPLALRAEVLAPDKVTIPAIKEFLSEKYGCKIDKDGDLVINGKNGKTFISVNAKTKMIRLLGLYSAYKKRTAQEMIVLANQFNYDKRFIRVSINPKSGNCECDYYLLYAGGLDSASLLEALDWFDGMRGAWESYVINGGDKKKAE